MSFVAFPANVAGTPPAPFRPFEAGTVAFYLVGVDTGTGAPAPAGQLTVETETVEGSGPRPVDTVTETATGKRGRRNVTVAIRTFRFERYTRGSKAAARDAAQWRSPEGQPLRLWAHVVAVADAAERGYRVPSRQIRPRFNGARAVGVENTVAATVAVTGYRATVAPAPAAALVIAPAAPVTVPVAAATPAAVDPIAAAVDAATRGTAVTVPPLTVAPERFNPYRPLWPTATATPAPVAPANAATRRGIELDPVAPVPAPVAPLNPEPTFKPRPLDLD